MKSIEESYDALYKVYEMSCKPKTERIRKGTIIDEEQSVRWNKEEVERRIAAYDAEVKELNTQKNKTRDKAEKELFKVIQHEIKGISEDSAREIFHYIEEQEDGECKENHVIAMYDLIGLISKCVKEVKG